MVVAPLPPAPPARIVFTSGRTGVEQLYSVRTDGLGLAQVTFGSTDACEPRSSPNGTLVAYGRSGSVGVCEGEHGVLASAAGRRGPAVPWTANAAWSPDSRWLAEGSDNGLRLVPLGSATSVRRLIGGNDHFPAWAPSGRALAFLRSLKSGSQQLIVVRRGGETVLTSTNGSIAPAWSADGKLLAFTTAIDTEVVPSAGGVPRRVFAAPALSIAWSTYGSELAVSSRTGVVLVGSDGTARTLTATSFTSLVWRDALYGTDGTRLIRVALDGRTTTLYDSGDGDFVSGTEWSRPPASTRFRTPAPPAPAIATATPTVLDSPYPVTGLAADGDSAAAVIGCPDAQIPVVWRAGPSRVAGPLSAYACHNHRDPLSRADLVALGNGLPAAVSSYGGTSLVVWG